MIRSSHVRRSWFLGFTLMLAGAGACSRKGPSSSDTPELLGTISLPLKTTTNGHNYRLRNFSVFISGYSSTNSFMSFTLSDNGLDRPLTADVPAGNYSASIYSYTLEIDDGTGNYVPVRSQLEPSNLQFTVYAGTTTTLTLRFQTDGIVVTTGTGTVTTQVQVDETPPACQPLSTSCGSGRWCPPFDLSGAAPACVTAGTKQLGAACAGPTDCVGNASCFDLGAGPACVALCPSSMVGSACPVGGTCVAKGKTYGLCQAVAGGDGGSGADAGAGDAGVEGTACQLCSFGPVSSPACQTMPNGCSNCIPDTDGCSSISDPTDKQLCLDLYTCLVTSACISQGDPLSCWCGTALSDCTSSNEPPTMANGPCVDKIRAAAKLTTYNAAIIAQHFVDPNLPLGRAVNLASCQSNFCSSECGVPF